MHMFWSAVCQSTKQKITLHNIWFYIYHFFFSFLFFSLKENHWVENTNHTFISKSSNSLALRWCHAIMSLWLPHSSSSSRGNDMSSYRYSLATDPSASSLWKDDTRFPPHLITIIGHLKVPPNNNCVQEGWKNKDKLSETRKYCNMTNAFVCLSIFVRKRSCRHFRYIFFVCFFIFSSQASREQWDTLWPLEVFCRKTRVIEFMKSILERL